MVCFCLQHESPLKVEILTFLFLFFGIQTSYPQILPTLKYSKLNRITLVYDKPCSFACAQPYSSILIHTWEFQR